MKAMGTQPRRLGASAFPAASRAALIAGGMGSDLRRLNRRFDQPNQHLRRHVGQ
jgi:hypothetical protein